MKWLITVVAVLFASAHQASAQAVVVLNNTNTNSNSNSNSSGVEIIAGGWSAAVHADATYNAMSNAKNGSLGQYDFYYSLEAVPPFDTKYSNCATAPDFPNILKTLFGTTTGAHIVGKTDVQYRWTTGIEVDFRLGRHLCTEVTGTLGEALCRSNSDNRPVLGTYVARDLQQLKRWP